MKIFIFLIFSLVSHYVIAGNQTGKITMLYARAGDNLHLVMLSGPKTNLPACATAGYWLIKDENSVAGRSQFSQLLAAQMAGRHNHGHPPVAIPGGTPWTPTGTWSAKLCNTRRFSS